MLVQAKTRKSKRKHTRFVTVAGGAHVGDGVHVVVVLALLTVGAISVVGTVDAVPTMTGLAPQGLIEVAPVGAAIAVAC